MIREINFAFPTYNRKNKFSRTVNFCLMTSLPGVRCYFLLLFCDLNNKVASYNSSKYQFFLVPLILAFNWKKFFAPFLDGQNGVKISVSHMFVLICSMFPEMQAVACTHKGKHADLFACAIYHMCRKLSTVFYHFSGDTFP